MSRMDVKTKLELSFVFESYWDMLPREIQEYIIHLKISQQNIDQENRDRMKNLCREIIAYGQLKAKWGRGHIKCRMDHCKCKRYSQLKISACYVNEYNDKCEMYLGHGFEQAWSRVNHVKSFL